MVGGLIEITLLPHIFFFMEIIIEKKRSFFTVGKDVKRRVKFITHKKKVRIF